MPEPEGPWSGLEPPPAPPPPPWRRDPRVRLAVTAAVLGLLVLGVWGMTRILPGEVSQEDWPQISYQLGFVALVALGLLSRPMRLGQALRYIAIWGAVVAVVGLGYVYRGALMDAALRLRSALVPAYVQPSAAHELVLSQDDGGGYSVMGAVNGQPVRFAVDTGASDIVLSPADATRLGIDLSRLDFSGRFATANGVGQGASYIAETLDVGPIQLRNVPMAIDRAPMGSSLLGMAFLRRLESFEVRDGRLYLRWRS
ncbi:MAG: TIGR02281 family clan AA aspartic protease [Caulobacteraceae bacterium]|nr:TIGR02281 family clan AA aspartic protease [Caulobacteraceae bacterium]